MNADTRVRRNRRGEKSGDKDRSLVRSFVYVLSLVFEYGSSTYRRKRRELVNAFRGYLGRVEVCARMRSPALPKYAQFLAVPDANGDSKRA